MNSLVQQMYSDKKNFFKWGGLGYSLVLEQLSSLNNTGFRQS
jgi:hypothetical protein